MFVATNILAIFNVALAATLLFRGNSDNSQVNTYLLIAVISLQVSNYFAPT